VNAVIDIPIRIGVNNREQWRERVQRVKAERHAVACHLIGVEKPALPCQVRLTRSAPSNGLDDAGLTGSCKAIRDQIAQWIGVDDETVRYLYRQKRGPWGVSIEFCFPSPTQETQPGFERATP
jgi:hypothetical protein